MTWKTAILSSALVLLPMAAAAQDGPHTQRDADPGRRAGASLGTAAQDGPQPQWDELVQSSALQPHEDVYVTLVTGRRIRGRIGEVTSTALTLTDGEDVQEYREAEIATIERRDPIGNGILIGMGVAGLAHLPILASYEGGYVFLHTFFPSLILGAATGAFTDWNLNEMLYQAGEAQVSVAPTLDIGNRGVGVRMSVGW